MESAGTSAQPQYLPRVTVAFANAEGTTFSAVVEPELWDTEEGKEHAKTIRLTRAMIGKISHPQYTLAASSMTTKPHTLMDQLTNLKMTLQIYDRQYI